MTEFKRNNFSQRRQELFKQLYQCGPRPLMELMLEVEAGRDLDERLEVYTKTSPERYRQTGADMLPIDYPKSVH